MVSFLDDGRLGEVHVFMFIGSGIEAMGEIKRNGRPRPKLPAWRAWMRHVSPDKMQNRLVGASLIDKQENKGWEGGNECLGRGKKEKNLDGNSPYM